jgi:hypothetical protein
MGLGLPLVSKAISCHVITYTLPYPSSQMVHASGWIESRTMSSGVSPLDGVMLCLWLTRIRSGLQFLYQ